MNQLIKVAAQVAIRSANEYMAAHKLKADNEALLSCVRSHIKAALPAALHDAKEAIECNMPKVAEQTFLASMSLAGIEAAKEASFPIAA